MELIALQILMLVFSVVVHEVAHGWTAWKLGDDTAYLAGRLTLNPLPHIDPVGSILVPLVLTLSGSGFLIAWAKPVPVNPGRLDNPRDDHVKVAAAGPISNLLLAFIFAVLLGLTWGIGGFAAPGHGGQGESSLLRFLVALLYTGVYINVILAMFNLLPLPPLDGSWILSRFLSGEVRARYENLRRFGMMIVIGFLVLMSMVPGGNPFWAAIEVVRDKFLEITESVARMTGA